MANYFVDSTTGSDAGLGTSADPWETLQKAIDDSDGGDTINLSNDGAFVLSTEITWALHGSVTANSQNAPLTIRSWDNGGSLTITHVTGTRVAAEIDGNDAVAGVWSSTSIIGYVQFLDIRFRRCTGNMNGGSNWRAIFCEFTDMGGTAMVNLHPILCYFHDDGGSSVNGYGSASASSYFNRFDNVSGDTASHNTDGVAYVGNISKDMGEDGTPGDDNCVYLFNTFVGKVGSGVTSGLSRGGGNRQNIVIGNVFTQFNGTGGIGFEMGTAVWASLLNSFFNNDTDTTGSAILDVENTVPESSNPLQDFANDDFRIVSGATGEKVIPSYAGASANMNFKNAGAVQNDPDAGGGGISVEVHNAQVLGPALTPVAY